MQVNYRKAVSSVALAGTILASSLVPSGQAYADKSKTYKTGALVLGGLAAVLLLKKKTLPAAVAGAGAYYAYKKSKDAKQQQQAQYPVDGTYSQYPDYVPGSSYPTAYPGAPVPDGTYGTYPDYGTTSYPENGDQYPDYGYDAFGRRTSRIRTNSRVQSNGSGLVLR